MLTEEFYAECHKVVLKGINQGLIICPPLEKTAVDSKNPHRAVRSCSVCKAKVEMNSVWQKMCNDCSIQRGRERDKARRILKRANSIYRDE